MFTCGPVPSQYTLNKYINLKGNWKHLSGPIQTEKAMAPHSSTLAWKIPGRLQSMRSLRVGHDWATSLSLHAWRIPGMGEPGGLPSMGSHRVGHNWSNLAAAAAYKTIWAVASSVHPLLWEMQSWGSRGFSGLTQAGLQPPTAGVLASALCSLPLLRSEVVPLTQWLLSSSYGRVIGMTR